MLVLWRQNIDLYQWHWIWSLHMRLNLYIGRQRKLVPLCISNMYLRDTCELKKWTQIVTVLVHMLCCYFKICNTGADSCTAVKGMACINSSWKPANQSNDWRIRRRSFQSRSDYNETSIHHCHIHHFPTVIFNFF